MYTGVRQSRLQTWILGQPQTNTQRRRQAKQSVLEPLFAADGSLVYPSARHHVKDALRLRRWPKQIGRKQKRNHTEYDNAQNRI